MKLLMEISSKKYDASRNKIARKFNSICFNKGSSDSVVIPAGSVIEEAEKVAAVHRFDYGSFYPAEGAASHNLIVPSGKKLLLKYLNIWLVFAVLAMLKSKQGKRVRPNFRAAAVGEVRC